MIYVIKVPTPNVYFYDIPRNTYVYNEIKLPIYKPLTNTHIDISKQKENLAWE